MGDSLKNRLSSAGSGDRMAFIVTINREAFEIKRRKRNSTSFIEIKRGEELLIF